MKLSFLMVVFLLRTLPISADESKLCRMTEEGIPCPTECAYTWWRGAYICTFEDSTLSKCLDEEVDCSLFPKTTEVSSSTTPSTTTTTTEIPTTTTLQMSTTSTTATSKASTTTPTTPTAEPTTTATSKPTTTVASEPAPSTTSTTTTEKSSVRTSTIKVSATSTTISPTPEPKPTISEKSVSTATEVAEAPSTTTKKTTKVSEPALDKETPAQEKTTSQSTQHHHTSKVSASADQKDVIERILSSKNKGSIETDNKEEANKDIDAVFHDLLELEEEEDEAQAIIYAAIWAFVAVAAVVFAAFGAYLGIRKLRSTPDESYVTEEIIQKQVFNDLSSVQERLAQGDAAVSQIVETKDETKI